MSAFYVPMIVFNGFYRKDVNWEISHIWYKLNKPRFYNKIKKWKFVMIQLFLLVNSKTSWSLALLRISTLNGGNANKFRKEERHSSFGIWYESTFAIGHFKAVWCIFGPPAWMDSRGNSSVLNNCIFSRDSASGQCRGTF